ncbi:aldehyde dehydrogenase family protein [Streptomyces sp. NPDC092295]|uniref:aldehyde dehydrogenase family protein n=1 Tax=Streptomyces sp. NPDC092295 TaxID=3366011 RepID=UPI003830B05C
MNRCLEHLHIGGTWVRPDTKRRITPVNPSTDECLAHVPEGTAVDIDVAIDAARTAFETPDGWASWTPSRRVPSTIDQKLMGFSSRT